MYNDGNRALQDEFGSRKLADRLVQELSRNRFTDGDKQFVESSPFFFLATADADGRPDCSFKGGLPGFAREICPTCRRRRSIASSGGCKSIRRGPRVACCCRRRSRC